MPLGDSITEITCWRAYVWDQFAEVGLIDQVDFVGSMNNNVQGCTTQSPGFDVDHEGHSGWQAVDIANDHLEGWLQQSTPDVVQFMLGTNDVNNGRTTDAIIEAYTTMVNLMRASNPSMKIIVCPYAVKVEEALLTNRWQVDLVIPLVSNNGAIDAINARIPGWADGLSTAESPIYIADCSTNAGFTFEMLSDGIHPNDMGDQLIAQQVGPLVIQAVEEVIAGRS